MRTNPKTIAFRVSESEYQQLSKQVEEGKATSTSQILRQLLEQYLNQTKENNQ